jgi:hypothetical protein
VRGVEAVDVQLEDRVSPEQIEAMRSALASLPGIKGASLATGANASAYLYVRDAPVPCNLREGSHTDPDGNLIRFGSPVDE